MRPRALRRQAARRASKLDARAIVEQLHAGTASPETLASMRATREALREIAASGDRNDNVVVMVPPGCPTTGDPRMDRPCAVLFSNEPIAAPRVYFPLPALAAALRREGNERMADYLAATPLDLIPAIIFAGPGPEDCRVARIQPIAFSKGGAC